MYEVARIDALALVRRFHTNDPFRIAEALGVFVRYTPFLQLKGAYIYFNREHHIIVNSTLPEEEQRLVCAHELGHVRLHRDAAVMAALEDYSFLNLRGRIEYEANLFAAELLLDDGEVFSLMQEYTRDQAAAILRIDPGLLDFKLFSMQKRDFQIRLPITFDSEFLAK